jgi:hypothetical protein
MPDRMKHLEKLEERVMRTFALITGSDMPLESFHRFEEAFNVLEKDIEDMRAEDE